MRSTTIKAPALRRHVFILAVLLALVIPAYGSTAGASSAPALRNPTATAKSLITQYFVLLQKKNVPGLQQFLSPAFQIERADGSGSGKVGFLANLPTVQTFTINDVSARQIGPVLVARYTAIATGLVNGKPYTPGPAPRLSVFSWNGTRWQIVAHANFNPLTG